MKHLVFEEYTGPAPDPDGDEQETTVRACVITDEYVYLTDQDGNKKRREVMTPVGARQVSAGDVFVETETPGVYDYLTAAAWASTAYGADSDEDSDEDTAPAPAKKTAAKRTLPGNGNGS